MFLFPKEKAILKRKNVMFDQKSENKCFGGLHIKVLLACAQRNIYRSWKVPERTAVAQIHRYPIHT